MNIRTAVLLSATVSLVVGILAGAVGGAYGKDLVLALRARGQDTPAVSVSSTISATTTPEAVVSFPSEEGSVVTAVGRVAPAVVSILLSNERREIGGGTGFIITDDGLVLTNRHVVADDSVTITVVLADKRRFPGRVLARDPVLDLAVVKIDATNLPVAPLGDSSKLRIGETAIAIGNTLSEYPNTVTRGIVSGLARRVVAGDGFGANEVIEEAIQTDAAINPGNSGGPLINVRGNVIGVNVAVTRGAEGVGFAIPVNIAKRVIDSVKKTGRIVRPWLGVRYIIIDEEVARRNALPVTAGALVVRGAGRAELAVVPGSPAERAGIRENDIILELGGVRIDEDHSLAALISARNPGDIVRIKILRQGNEQMMNVTLAEYKEGVE